MDRLYNEPTSYLPLVEFEKNGRLKMEGRSIPENVNRFFDPLFNFVSELQIEDVIFDLNLEYFNTSTSKKLLELLKHIESNNNISNILINWYYEEGDEDSVEMAEIYEDCLLRSEFKYHKYAELGHSFSTAQIN